MNEMNEYEQNIYNNKGGRVSDSSFNGGQQFQSQQKPKSTTNFMHGETTYIAPNIENKKRRKKHE